MDEQCHRWSARASKILNEHGEAQVELIGKAVVFTDGKAGAVENVSLDELHGASDFDQRSWWKMAGRNHKLVES
jgi:hypothetical protein